MEKWVVATINRLAGYYEKLEHGEIVQVFVSSVIMELKFTSKRV